MKFVCVGEILIKTALLAETCKRWKKFSIILHQAAYSETMLDESPQFSLNFAFLLSQTPRDFKELSKDFPANIECQ